MSICRIIPCRADTAHEVMAKIRYVIDPQKNVVQGRQLAFPGMVKGHLLPDDPNYPAAIFASFMAPHHAYGDVRGGHRLFYHFLMDFGGMVSPEQAIELGWQIAMWFRQFHVQYLQGLHCIKSGRNGLTGPVFWPHVHLLVSTRMLDGSGTKLHIGKAELRALKIFANETVLIPNGLPPIEMREKTYEK